jgi:hypothetical protein
LEDLSWEPLSATKQLSIGWNDTKQAQSICKLFWPVQEGSFYAVLPTDPQHHCEIHTEIIT